MYLTRIEQSEPFLSIVIFCLSFRTVLEQVIISPGVILEHLFSRSVRLEWRELCNDVKCVMSAIDVTDAYILQDSSSLC